MSKKLYKSSRNKMIFGVCGGLAEYFDADVTVIRLIVALAAICSCSFIFWVYLLCAVVMKYNPAEITTGVDNQ